MWNNALQVTNMPVEDQKELVELVRRVHLGAGWEVPKQVDALEVEARLGSFTAAGLKIEARLQLEGQNSLTIQTSAASSDF